MAERHPEADLISALLDGDLTPAEAGGLERHLSACSPCAAERDAADAARALLREARSVPMPLDLRATLEAQLTRPSWADRAREWVRMPAVWAPAGLAAAAVIVFALFSNQFGQEADLPLEPLLAAHERYAAESLVPTVEMRSIAYSQRVAAYYEDR